MSNFQPTPSIELQTEAQKLWPYAFYIVLGLIAVVGNLVVFVGISGSGSFLRIRYALTIALALADIISGFAYFSAGIARTIFILEKTDRVLTSKYHCMLRPYNWLWIIAMQTPVSMACAIAVERLFAIRHPIFFRKKRNTFTWISIILIYTAALVSALAAISAAYLEGERGKPENTCLHDLSTGTTFAIFSHSLAISLGIASAVIYFFAWHFMKKKSVHLLHYKSRRETQVASDPESQQRQNRITVMMAIIVGFTVILMVIPQTVMLIMAITEVCQDVQNIVVPILGIFLCSNSAINVIVYSLVNPELRELFAHCCRKVWNRRCKVENVPADVFTVDEIN